MNDFCLSPIFLMLIVILLCLAYVVMVFNSLDDM